MDAARAVHHDEGVLAHQAHQVRGVVEALLADEAVELGDPHLVHRPGADQRLDHARPLGAFGQGHLHRRDVPRLEHGSCEDRHTGARGAQALQGDHLALLGLAALLARGADAAVLDEAGQVRVHHAAFPVASSDRRVNIRCSDSEGEAGTRVSEGL